MIFDQMNRVTSQTDPANATTAYTYDQNGNQLSMTNALNNTWTMQFDAKDRVISKRFPLTLSDNGVQREVRVEYNKNDELTASISPSGRTWRYTYDARGQRKTMSDPLGGIVSYDYDINQNMILFADQRNNVTSYEYDELYRVTKVTDPSNKITRYNYDTEDNVVSMIDKLGRTTTAIYDELDRAIRINYADAIVSYQYDAAGRQTRIDDTQFGGTFIAWNYDDADRLINETTPQGTVNYIYNASSQIISTTANSNPSINYTYDSAARLETISQNLIGQLEVVTYNYDLIGRKTSIQRPNSISTIYEYDQVNRLIRLKHQKTNNSVIEDLQYNYNTDSEIASIASLNPQSLLPIQTNISSANANNRISQFGSASFTFNDVGQTTSKSASGVGTTQYLWDHRGRLTRVILPDNQQIDYSYDAEGKRVSRTTNSNGVATQFLYDQDDVIIDINSIGSNTFYLNGLMTDQKLRQSNSNNNIYILRNHIDSSIAFTDTSGNIVEQPQYEAFGKNANSSISRYLYTGREQDVDAGLIYYRARWYDSQQGRFLSEDPIEFDGGLNFYVYAYNNPIKFVDPSGLFAQSKVEKQKLGCGPGGFGDVLIPDLRFKIPCAIHDLCYTFHWFGNDKYGKEKCDDLLCKNTRKACREQCKGFRLPERPLCLIAARVYCRAVKTRLADGAFNNPKNTSKWPSDTIMPIDYLPLNATPFTDVTFEVE